MDKTNSLHYFMDETDAPYEEGEKLIPHTIEDDLFLLKIVEKYNLELKPDNDLAKLRQNKEKNKIKGIL